MKRLILNLFVASSIILSIACSSDDDAGDNNPAPNELTVTIDGEALVFNNISVDTSNGTEDNISVTATINGGTSKILNLTLSQGSTGAGAIDFIAYILNDEEYSSNPLVSSIVSEISVNDGQTLAGSFSGTVSRFNVDTQTEEFIIFTEGTIYVVY